MVEARTRKPPREELEDRRDRRRSRPVALAAADRSGREGQRRSGVKPTERRGSGARRVLVVDDSDVFRRFLVRAIALMGWETVECGSADEALDIFFQSSPRVVILDWNIHGETSRVLLRQLADRGGRVVVMTGDPGAVGDVGVPVLEKPVSLSLLREMLERS